MKSDDGVFGMDIESVGSCESLLNENSANLVDELALDNVYSGTHIGQCLDTVLNEMTGERDINIHQQLALRKAFNFVHYRAFEQCQNSLHLDIAGKTQEFSLRDNASYFHVNVRIFLQGSSIRIVGMYSIRYVIVVTDRFMRYFPNK